MELHVLRTIDESANQRFKAACDFARQLEAQRDSARKERDALQLQYDSDKARGHKYRDKLEAQLAAMQSLINELVERRSDPLGFYYTSKNLAGLGSELSHRVEAVLSPTSGQALLDRLAKAEEDSKIVDYIEQLRVDCEGRVLTLLLMPGDETIRQRASAMRKDGHE
jgi:hypothetical protein